MIIYKATTKRKTIFSNIYSIKKMGMPDVLLSDEVVAR